MYSTKRRPEKEMLFGTRAVIEALRAGKNIEKILIRRDMNNALVRELYQALGGEHVPVQKVPVEKLNHLTDRNHQGVVAFTSPVIFQHIADIIPSLYERGKTPFVVALDGVTDVRNFGAIARSCVCAGADALVIAASGSAAAGADAIKTSAGALLHLPLCREANMAKTLQFLAESGLKTVAVSEKAAQNYTEISLTEPLVLGLGSEENGISPEVLRHCSHAASIPLFGAVQSLNVSVAAGIMLYEVVRQREM